MKTYIIIFILINIFINQGSAINLSPRRGEILENQFQVFSVPFGATFKQKWTVVFQQNNNLEIFKEFIDLFVERAYKKKNIPQDFFENIEDLVERYGYQHQQMVEEIKIISEVSGVELKKLYILNFTYEIFANQKACTSIIARKQNGDIILGRNIDYFFEQYYSDLSIQFDYYNENKEKLYSTQAYVGYAVALTGIRYGQYSISFNQREQGSLTDSYKNFLQGAFSNQYLVQQVLQNVDSFDQALNILRNEQIIASCYYIITGIQKNQGIIIERDRENVYDEYELNDKKWYQVVTNYDRNQNDIDNRRSTAIEKLEEIRQDGIDEQKLKEILTTYPVFHRRTITTSIMNANTQYFESYVWY